MDFKEEEVDQHETTLNGFNPMDHQSDTQMRGLMSTGTAATGLNSQDWERVKPQVAPYVWAWYDQHKDNKVATIMGVYRITVGSFRIAEMVITAIFGPRPQENSALSMGEGEAGTNG